MSGPTDETTLTQVIRRMHDLEKVLGLVVLHVGLGTKNEEGNVVWEPAGEETSLEKWIQDHVWCVLF